MRSLLLFLSRCGLASLLSATFTLGHAAQAGAFSVTETKSAIGNNGQFDPNNPNIATTGIVSIVPMLFYDLNGKKKEQMYEELLERRAALSKEATMGDLEALEKLAKAQMEIGSRKQEL